MIVREVKERVICGHNYKVTLLGAKRGRVLLVHLVRTFGPSLAAFMEGVLNAKGGLTESLTLGGAEAVRELTSKLTDKEVTELSDELAKYTRVVLDAEREPMLFDVFDDHFAGRYDAFLQWLAFALEANFASFFGASSSSGTQLLGRLRALIKSVSASPPASTGTSTESPAASATATAT